MTAGHSRPRIVGTTGLAIALTTSILIGAPAHANPEIDPQASFGTSAKPTTRSTRSIQSGNLGGGKKFVLPDARTGKAPFPALAARAVTPIPGGLAAPAGKVDPAGAYVPQTSCDPKEKRGITAFKQAVLKMYPATTDWGSSRNCSDDGISEHLEGRAWDWNADSAKVQGFRAATNLLNWLTANKGANARRLGIMYIGYNHRIWGIYRVNEGWRQLNNSNPHTDHVHFSFTWRGASKQTSFWTGKVYKEDYGPCKIFYGQPAPIRTGANSTPCSDPQELPRQYRGKQVLWRGSNSSTVKTVQQKLHIAPRNGFFGESTQAAVAAFQAGKSLPITGAVDAQTWFALGLSTLPTAVAKPKPLVTVKRKKRYRTLSVGSRGKAVLRLQIKLRLRAKYRTGYFGSITKRKVKRKQLQLGRKPTGKASPSFQKKIGL